MIGSPGSVDSVMPPIVSHHGSKGRREGDFERIEARRTRHGGYGRCAAGLPAAARDVQPPPSPWRPWICAAASPVLQRWQSSRRFVARSLRTNSTELKLAAHVETMRKRSSALAGLTISRRPILEYDHDDSRARQTACWLRGRLLAVGRRRLSARAAVLGVAEQALWCRWRSGTGNRPERFRHGLKRQSVWSWMRRLFCRRRFRPVFTTSGTDARKSSDPGRANGAARLTAVVWAGGTEFERSSAGFGQAGRASKRQTRPQLGPRCSPAGRFDRCVARGVARCYAPRAEFGRRGRWIIKQMVCRPATSWL